MQAADLGATSRARAGIDAARFCRWSLRDEDLENAWLAYVTDDASEQVRDDELAQEGESGIAKFLDEVAGISR